MPTYTEPKSTTGQAYLRRPSACSRQFVTCVPFANDELDKIYMSRLDMCYKAVTWLLFQSIPKQ